MYVYMCFIYIYIQKWRMVVIFGDNRWEMKQLDMMVDGITSRTK